MYDLEQAINDRRSTRMFLPDKPVPRELVDQALELAIRAPSNSNVQPWHLRLVSGAARDRLVAALLAEATSKPPVVPELPELFAHLRRDLGAKI
jgi:nitroreductase